MFPYSQQVEDVVLVNYFLNPHYPLTALQWMFYQVRWKKYNCKRYLKRADIWCLIFFIIRSKTNSINGNRHLKAGALFGGSSRRRCVYTRWEWKWEMIEQWQTLKALFSWFTKITHLLHTLFSHLRIWRSLHNSVHMIHTMSLF